MRKLAEPPAAEGVSVVKIEVADGPTTTLRLRKDGDAHWLSIAATGEGEASQESRRRDRRPHQGLGVPGSRRPKAEAILKKRADLWKRRRLTTTRHPDGPVRAKGEKRLDPGPRGG